MRDTGEQSWTIYPKWESFGDWGQHTFSKPVVSFAEIAFIMSLLSSEHPPAESIHWALHCLCLVLLFSLYLLCSSKSIDLGLPFTRKHNYQTLPFSGRHFSVSLKESSPQMLPFQQDADMLSSHPLGKRHFPHHTPSSLNINLFPHIWL